MLDDDAAAFERTYMAEGVLLATVTDPRTKTLDFPSDEDKEHAKTALDPRVKNRPAGGAEGRCCRRCQQCLCFLGRFYVARD